MTFATLFPGQGSQSLGMLAELAEAYPAVQQTFAEASEVLGFDLWDMVQNGPETELNRTQNTQPAMLAAGVAVWRAWNEAGGPEPEAMAGHSLGEFTALVCAGALAFGDAVGLVAER
ncbi:MAG: ACP S-malonyltransferase, partial [Anaerolineae bacterium]